jgi:hypothetical protein
MTAIIMKYLNYEYLATMIAIHKKTLITISIIVMILLCFIILNRYEKGTRLKLVVPSSIWSFDIQKENFAFECDNGRIGLQFNTNFTHYLQYFKLLIDNKPDSYATLHEFPVFLTAFSDNHLLEGERLIAQMKAYFPTKKLIVYDIGLDEAKREQIRQQNSHVLMKQFNFSAYPAYVRLLKEYRWKPLIIAEELLHHPAVMWMDSSAYWKHGNISELLIRIQNQSFFPWTLVEYTVYTVKIRKYNITGCRNRNAYFQTSNVRLF